MKRAKIKGSKKEKMVFPEKIMSKEDIDDVNSAINKNTTIMFMYIDLLELTAGKVSSSLKNYGMHLKAGYKNKIEQILALSKKTRKGIECIDDEHQEKFGDMSDAFYDLNYYVLDVTGGKPESIYKIIEALKDTFEQ